MSSDRKLALGPLSTAPRRVLPHVGHCRPDLLQPHRWHLCAPEVSRPQHVHTQPIHSGGPDPTLSTNWTASRVGTSSGGLRAKLFPPICCVVSGGCCSLHGRSARCQPGHGFAPRRTECYSAGWNLPYPLRQLACDCHGWNGRSGRGRCWASLGP